MIIVLASANYIVPFVPESSSASELRKGERIHRKDGGGRRESTRRSREYRSKSVSKLYCQLIVVF